MKPSAGDTRQIGWQAISSGGVIAAGAAEAVAAGIKILELGGNAADAAIATILALTVTDHGECSIGGEVPLLIYDAGSRQVRALSGQGGAPLSPEAIAWYMTHGIPVADVKMAPVPSVVDLCITTLQHYGTRSFADVCSPTLALLDAGEEDWHPRLARTLHRMVEEETRIVGSREIRLQAACDRFYGRHPERNDIAEELEAFYIERGGFLRRRDLAVHRTRIEASVSVDYRGYAVHKCGTWTQGPYLCQALRLLESFDLRSMGHLSADYIHVVTEALKLAMADRDQYYGDPEFVGVPLGSLLTDAYTEMRRALIDMQNASHEARPGDPYTMQPLLGSGVFRPGTGGTTTCVVADRWGNVVAATPSANVHLDGGWGQAGVTYGNRLRSLNTTPGHPNCIQPGKRPRITLTPTLVLKAGEPVLAISVAGGDLQDQVTVNLLLDAIDLAMSPAEAVRVPRFATYHHQDSFNPDPLRQRTFIRAGSLTVNEGIEQTVRTELACRHHQVEVRQSAIGCPVVLQRDPATGVVAAAGDPAAGRHAAGVGDDAGCGGCVCVI